MRRQGPREWAGILEAAWPPDGRHLRGTPGRPSVGEDQPVTLGALRRNGNTVLTAFYRNRIDETPG